MNAKFAASLGLAYPILSDPTKEVARAYGVLGPSGYASRWTFYIGADGRILDIDTKVSAASHGSDVVAKLTRSHKLTPPCSGGQAGAHMALLDRFRTHPGHKNPDAAVRLQFVQEIPLDERDLLPRWRATTPTRGCGARRSPS